MKWFIVGGYVRDTLLGLMPKDKDYVVINSSHEEMVARGFLTVGADFPVYLHPETHEEYALARIERKVGVGYNGFVCDTRDVTLEQDLGRRDLTINAMAFDHWNNLIDPYHGRDDLNNKVLRHVSASAFIEDPVRVLRLGRFASRYPEFEIDDDTFELCKKMQQSGELNHLTRERVWKEVEKTLTEADPCQFFTLIYSIGAMIDVFGTDKLFWSHMEQHTDPVDRFAAMFKDHDTLNAFVSKVAVSNEYVHAAQMYIDIFNGMFSLQPVVYQLFKQYRKLPIKFEHTLNLFYNVEFNRQSAPIKYINAFRAISSWRMRDHLTPEQIKAMAGAELREFEDNSLQRIFWK